MVLVVLIPQQYLWKKFIWLQQFNFEVKYRTSILYIKWTKKVTKKMSRRLPVELPKFPVYLK